MKLPFLLDLLLPRFITEDAAAQITYCDQCANPHPMPVCSMADVRPGEVFDGIITMRSFNLFGFAIFARFDMDSLRPFVNPHDQVKP